MILDDDILIKKSNVLANHWAKYFLYFSIFLWRISSIGPSNLLNESLSIDTNLQRVSALIVACRTVFFTKAISPK